MNSINEQTNEVARLREVCEWAADMMDGISPARGQEIRDALARLTPTTEETSEKDTSTETCPSKNDNEWRELGPDEVIQERDEVQPKRHSKNGKWIWVRSWELGVKAGHIKAMRYRTRRPLPVKEEIPLEGDIASIEWSCAHTAKAIRYLLQQINTLRDEIQKLKYNQEIYENAGQNIINRIVKLESK